MHLHRESLRSPWLAACLVALPLAACSPGAAPPAAPAPEYAAAVAQPTPAPAVRATRVTTVEGITEYTLPNGLRVLLFPDESKPTTTVNITYLVGSRHEAYGETGMAHLLEHLLFKGTPKHPNIPQELTERGARPNGTTWYDRTNYFETFPATAEHLEWALDLEADRMVNSFVAQKDLDSEMTVVRNEFESGENYPFSVLMERVLSTAYLWHNYGKSTIGARSDLENVPIERLQAFYRRYYQPDNAILVVAGKFDEAQALRLIEEKFGAIPRPDRTAPGMQVFPTYTKEPAQDGERTVTLRRVGDVQLINAAYHVPPGSHDDFPAIHVLEHVLGDSPSGRLHKALVETGKAARVGAWAFQLREPGVLMAFAEVRKDRSLEEARAAFTRTIDQLITQGPTDEEVERAKLALLKNIELSLNASDRVGIELSEWASIGDWRLLFLHRDRLRQVTAADVKRVAATYLKPDNRTLGLFIPTEQPQRAEVPTAPDVAALVQNYRGDTTVVAGEAFDPSPGNVEARTRRATLPSGFKLGLLPKRTRGGAVVAQVNLRLGDEQSLTGRATDALLTADMLMRGTRTRTRQQLQDEFDRLKARAWVSGSATQLFARVETTRENLPAALRLLGEVLREPRFDAAEFQQLREEELARIEEQRSDPRFQAYNALDRHLRPRPQGHPLYTPTADERVAALKAARLEDAKRFYQEFYGAGAGELAVVGDFDAEEIQRIGTEVFGEWRSKRPFRRIATENPNVGAKHAVLETPDKTNAFFAAGLNLEVNDTHPDYPALVLGNYMMGGGFLNSRLATRIRQKDGLSYGVSSSLTASVQDRLGRFGAYAISAPENSEKVEAAFREELERALRDGFTAEEVQKAKEGYLQSRQVGRAQDGALVGTLASWLYLDRKFDYDAELERRVEALTPEQIVEAMRRHIDPAKISIVRAGDFKKAAAPK